MTYYSDIFTFTHFERKEIKIKISRELEVTNRQMYLIISEYQLPLCPECCGFNSLRSHVLLATISIRTLLSDG
jgi:hypothetical protein